MQYLVLRVNTVDTSVTQTCSSLMANTSGAVYQWIDCNNANAPVNGQTEQAFTFSYNGSYGVIITKNGCTDTSACFNITTTGITENNISPGLKIFPNPSNGTFAIKAVVSGKYSIMNSLGQIIKTFELAAGSVTTVSNIESGVYYLQLNGNEKASRKIVVISE